jgi:uncharacterized alpha-E superfamily protein
MTDIVERLANPSGIGEPTDHAAMEAAKTEIERLREWKRKTTAQAEGAHEYVLAQINADLKAEVEQLRDDLRALYFDPDGSIAELSPAGQAIVAGTVIAKPKE